MAQKILNHKSMCHGNHCNMQGCSILTQPLSESHNDNAIDKCVNRLHLLVHCNGGEEKDMEGGECEHGE